MTAEGNIKVFEKQEYLDRIAKAKALMLKCGIDTLLVSRQTDMLYLTGYAGLSSYVPQMVVLSIEENDPWIVLREMDTACAQFTVYMHECRIIGYPETYIGITEKNGYDFIIDKLKDWGLAKKNLGVEKEVLSILDWEKFQSKLPNAQFIDSSSLVSLVRQIKSENEIFLMKQAAELADLSMQAAITNINVGARECDVAAALFSTLIGGAEPFGGEVTDIPAVASGNRTSAPHLVWTDKRYSNNTPVNIELGGCRHRYVSALARSIYLGKPPTALLRLHEVTLCGMEAVFSQIKPGMLCEEVYSVFSNKIGQFGYSKASRVGYSIGLDWLETSASFQLGDKTVLKPNMTFHLMLGMWDKGMGYNLSDTFRITDSGCETFAALPRELFVKN